MKYQIIVDSASDLTKKYLDDEEIGFKVVPLTIRTGEKEFVDDENLSTAEMLKEMHQNKKNGSACPSPESFLKEFDDSEYTFVVTITQKLSGCYNSACVARDSYDKKDHVYVIDSKAVSGVEMLIVDKLVSLIKKGLEFEEIIKKINTYRDERSLFFLLQKFDNLINNGRMSKIAGLIASTLVIRPICVAHEGEIKMAKKVIGIKNAFSKLVQMICEKAKEKKSETLIITECDAVNEANMIKTEVSKKYSFKDIIIKPMKGLCSFYALEKSVIVCM